MNRRQFMTVSGAACAAQTGLAGAAFAAEADAREHYELRRYLIETGEQKEVILTYLRDAAIPAWNRAGVAPVGVFLPEEDLSPIYVLLPHTSIESVSAMRERVSADEAYRTNGAAFINAPADRPAYKRIESSLLVAFTGMPALERPTDAPGRVFQLRIYESPSMKANKKKIEMFNIGEIAIFRKTGLAPVFFGQAIIGDRLPNLTYMLGFASVEEREAAWARFKEDPDWLELRAKPEYADKEIISGITNIPLKPAECSQI